MADDSTTDTTATTASETEATQQPETTESKDSRGDIPKEVQAALRKANKEAETLRLKLKEFEDRDKTEAQKQADRVALAERERDEARLAATRLEVATAKGLTPSQARRLTGSTREELEADAADFLADQKKTVRPSGSADQGPRGTAPTADPRQAMADFLSQNGLR